MKKLKSIISKALKEHVNNAINGNAIETAAIFDDNATIVEGESVFTGRAAIDKVEADFLETMKIIDMAHTIDGLTSEGNYAFQLGHIKGNLVMKADGTEIEMSNRYMASWKLQKDGSWRIYYFVYYP